MASIDLTIDVLGPIILALFVVTRHAFWWQVINLVFYISPNAYILGGPCRWFSNLVMWSAYIQWMCWGMLFAISTIAARNVMPLLEADNDTGNQLYLPVATDTI
jgi:hypothetical protein